MGGFTVYMSVILGLATAPLFLIFLDYRSKKSIWKAVAFLGAVVLGMAINAMLVEYLRFNILYLLPIYAALPFIAAFIRTKRA